MSAELQYKNALELLKYSMGYPMTNTLEITDTPEYLMAKTALSSGNIQSQPQPCNVTKAGEVV